MRYFLLTDLEGPAGVDAWAQTREGEGPAKTGAMRLLTGEVNRSPGASSPRTPRRRWSSGTGMGPAACCLS